MAHSQGWVKRYLKAFCKGFFVAVPVAVTFLDRVACVARVEGASMQPSLNPGGSQSSDVVLLNHWKVRNFEVQRGDIVSLVSPKNPEQKIIKRVIALEGDIVKFFSSMLLQDTEYIPCTILYKPLDTKTAMSKSPVATSGSKVIITDTVLTVILLGRPEALLSPTFYRRVIIQRLAVCKLSHKFHEGTQKSTFSDARNLGIMRKDVI
ncbi:mitochondrial inner membrane protease subunit 2 isoform X2 [Camelus dromedarius]|uniref:Mitochondrial inner membrane protease subunit 2 isoform X4 n=1 Tax=Camelus bactrianus TaxID=9837 RepID=A0AC58QLZ9_CAMBA